MSLLNDALRDLEKRPSRDGDSDASVPAGLVVGERRGSARVIALVGGVLVLTSGLAAGAIWLWGPGGASDASIVAGPEKSDRVEEDLASNTTVEANTENQPPAVIEPVAVPKPEPTEAESSKPEQEAATADAEPVTEVAVADGDDRAAQDNSTETSGVPEVTEAGPQAEDSTPASDDSSAASVREEAPAAGAGTTSQEPEDSGRPQVRELTPQEQERRLAREVEELLEQGNERAAAERLQGHLLLDSDAPRARAAMASYYLRMGRSDEVRHWLPDQVAALYPELRMLRARLAINEGDRPGALEWLQSDVPPIERHSDYHSMMATLYQQLDQPAEAVRIWGELLETDDSRGPWWAGLGIALESMGRSEGARSAYMQAALLPDLPAALRDYVEQRLSEGQG